MYHVKVKKLKRIVVPHCTGIWFKPTVLIPVAFVLIVTRDLVCRSAPFCWLPLSSTCVWCFTFPRLQQQPRYIGRWPRPQTKTPNVPQLEKNHFSKSDRKTTHGSISLDPINAPNCSHPTNVFVSVSCRWIGTFDLTNECAMHAKCKVLSSRTTSTSDQLIKNIYCVSVYIYIYT